MSDVPVFMLANLVVNDAAEYRKYEKGFFPLLKRRSGEFLTFDDAPHTFEGIAPRPGRVIIFKFPSEQRARAWYADPAYQALSDRRRAGSRARSAAGGLVAPPACDRLARQLSEA
ncbi:DUF1330 domain-containing protein [Immundisolibacter sp.]|uniref:DUF1330 domain-containing protein n=1 Tax=Immundisolibacter sp. TaxID=1934948 RepID=UPI00356220F4